MEKLGKDFNNEISSLTKIGEDNLKLLEKLKNLDKEKLVMVALGNSISTGFSFCDDNKPLLDRNILLETMCEEYGIDLYKYKFARSENNSDQNVLNWILNNYTEQDMNNMNRRDYENHEKNGNSLLTGKELDQYYGKSKVDDVHIQDILFNDGEDTANIVIYNGATGSFLDNITRGGIHKYKNGVNKDIGHIESVLSLIHNNNRENLSGTQVYLCGVPRLLNTGIQDYYMNRPIKTVSKRYPNVSYVDNFKRKVIYKGKNKVDLHYNKNEYLKLTHLIMKSVLENYEINSALIGIDRDLYHYNKEIEMGKRDNNSYNDILDIIEEYVFSFTEENEVELLKRVKEYLLERYCYDFFCLDKKAIKDVPTKLLRPNMI